MSKYPIPKNKESNHDRFIVKSGEFELWEKDKADKSNINQNVKKSGN